MGYLCDIMEVGSSYQEILVKLQDFITKYYMQKWLRGFLQLALLIMVFYLITTTLEYNLYFGTTVRTILYWIFVLGSIGLAVLWIGIPLMQYISYRSRLDSKAAASIIGNHFPEVKDKLLNVLFLQEMKQDAASYELINASIEQKSRSLYVVPFNDAIDWARSRKLGKYLILPVLIFIGLLVFFPNLIRESTYRMVHYDRKFTPKAPFDFVLKTQNLKVPQFESIEIRANMKGKTLPEQMNLFYEGVSYPMTYRDEEYSASIQNVEKSGSFRLESMGYYSDEYRLDIVPKPLIKNFELEIIPPSYTGLPASIQKNIGDISAPEGSTVIWKFQTENTDEIRLRFLQTIHSANKYINGYGFKAMVKGIESYQVLYRNQYSPYIDSQQYAVSLQRDAHPTVSVQEFRDSINDLVYYAGEVGDDYGVSALYMMVSASGRTTKYKVAVPQAKNASFQFSTRDIFKSFPKGSDLSYYFEVWDNDAVYGFKSSRSHIFQYRKMSEKEVLKQLEKNTSEIQSEIQKSIQDAQALQKEMESARKKLLEKNALDYNDKKSMESLVEKQKELQNKLEDIRKEMERNFDKKNELNAQEQAIKEQQKQLSEMIEQMKNPEYNDLLRKVEELLNKSDKREMMKNIEQMDSKSERMEKNMDRLLQLYKNLDYKQKVNDMIDKLDQLAKEQEKTALETELNKNTEKKQQELHQETKEVQKKMEELQKLNQELNKTDKKDFEEISKDIEEAEDQQEAAEDKLKENKLEDAAKKQRDAKNKLNDAKDKMSKLKKKQKKNQKLEDERTMRRVLENVMYLSFEQEKLIQLTQKIVVQSPSYPTLAQKQKKLLEDFAMVEDSLYKIAGRQPKIRKFIFEETEKITKHSSKSISRLVERQPHLAISEEQYAMTAYNNLGLSISESLKNIEEDEDENEDEKSGDQMCDNPKPGKKGKKKSMSLSKLAEMQEQLNEQMKELQKKMGQKPGQNPSEGKEGKDGQSGQKQGDKSQGGDAKELARIAAQQQAIRNALQKLENESNNPDKSGKKPLGNQLQEMIDKMNQTEKELVNKKIYEEMLKRQREIQVKLLESSKAQLEQEQEQKRESERAKNTPPEPPQELKKYMEEKNKNKNQIQRTPVGLTPYFKSLSEKYYQLIK